MAYAKTVTVQRFSSTKWVVTVAETEAAAASEAELVDSVTSQRPPQGCWLQRVIATRASGTAATRQPRLATTAAATSSQIRYQATATAVATKIDDGARTSFPIMLASAALFHRSQPDAGTDNVFTTIYELSTTAVG